MRVSFSSLFVLATAALGLAQPSRRKLSLNPPLSSLNPNFEAELGVPNPEPQSNAKRFAQGLPPLAPKALARHRHRHANRQAPHHGSPVDAARRSAPSSGPSVTVSCHVLARRQDGTDVGYITNTWNKYGEYGATQDGPDGALEVQFSYDPNDPGSLSSLDLLANNGPSGNYPYFGLTTGYEAEDDDIGPESYNYGYVVGTAKAPLGPPSSTTPNSFSSATGFEESTESAVWTYDPTSRSLTPRWINTDGSTPATYLVLGTDANGYPVFLMTGDPVALNTAFEANFPIVNFICV